MLLAADADVEALLLVVSLLAVLRSADVEASLLAVSLLVELLLAAGAGAVRSVSLPRRGSMTQMLILSQSKAGMEKTTLVSSAVLRPR